MKINIYLPPFVVPEISIRRRKGAANLLYVITCKEKRSLEMRKPASAPLPNPVSEFIIESIPPALTEVKISP